LNFFEIHPIYRNSTSCLVQLELPRTRLAMQASLHRPARNTFAAKSVPEAMNALEDPRDLQQENTIIYKPESFILDPQPGKILLLTLSSIWAQNMWVRPLIPSDSYIICTERLPHSRSSLITSGRIKGMLI